MKLVIATVAVVAVLTACGIAPSSSVVTPSSLATPAEASSVSLWSHDEPPDGPCMAALGIGELVAHQRAGMALRQEAMDIPIIWPARYSGRIEGGRLALVDAAGRVLAYVGDAVEIGGGFLKDDAAFHACGDVEVVRKER